MGHKAIELDGVDYFVWRGIWTKLCMLWEQ